MSLTCQQCHQPLLLDPSVSSLSPTSYSLVAGALPTDASASAGGYPSTSREAADVWARRGGGGVAESFVLLSDSVVSPAPLKPSTRSPGIPAIPSSELAANLHNLISSNTGISHPLCVECTGIIQAELQKELDELSRERDAYIAFEQGISRNTGEGSQEEWDRLTRRKAELEEQEARVARDLREREKELEAVRKEQDEVSRQEAELDREEEEFLRNHAALSTHLRHLSHELESAKTHLLASTSLLAHLESTNVYNDAFQIGYTPLPGRATTSHVGTINGLRLGGRPLVEWDEINAAWGHVALCVDRIAARVGFVFEKYKISPLGSYSRIDELAPSKQTYELYASPELSGFLHNRRFSHGLVALLDCIRQLVEFGQRGSRGWPIGSVDIRKDKISGYSIRLPGLASAMPALPMSIMGLGGSTVDDKSGNGGGSAREGRREKERADMSGEEQWTKACVAVLKVLKQILIAESEAER